MGCKKPELNAHLAYRIICTTKNYFHCAEETLKFG
jgi:hypothetical protein